MKPYLEHLLKAEVDSEEGRGLVREYLQARILEILQNAGAFLCLSFHEGTALRILYNLPRFSEDLDFSLDRALDEYDFTKYLGAIKKQFTAENYQVEVRTQRHQPVVNKAFVRFRGLLNEFGLSPHEDEVIAIKVEVDTRPPDFSISESTVLTRHVPLHLRHHDRSSLLGGKLMAALSRDYTKGRDVFDLWWYLEQRDWPLPNFAYLNRGLQQAGITNELTEENWKPTLHNYVKSLDWETVFRDVEPFIIGLDRSPGFSQERLLALLSFRQK
jgi:hypothetical protein